MRPAGKENYTYQDGELLICPMCGFEAEQQAWQAGETEAASEQVIKDAVGNVLQDGDSVTVIKDLKVKGASTPIKVGTKIKSIRLLHDAPDDHDIDCKIDGFGAMKLKSSVVKKLSLGRVWALFGALGMQQIVTPKAYLFYDPKSCHNKFSRWLWKSTLQ